MVEPELSSPTDAASATEQERRGDLRLPCILETSCRPLMAREGQAWAAQVHDISRGGIGLLSSRRFERGTLLLLDLENQGKNLCHTVVARVIHTMRREDGKWLVGCAFTAELEEEDLQQYGVQRVRPDVSDCRAWVRLPCEVETSGRPAGGEDPGSPWQIKVVNLSPGGIGLLVPRPVGRGALLYVELPDASGQGEKPVLVRVLHQKATDQGWLLGGEFASKLSEEDIQGLVE